MDRYELQDKLGEGGMGAVYRAIDRELGRVVAIKVMSMAMGTEAIRRFQREMRLLSKLSHPNIIRVYDCGQISDGRGYFAMELIDGVDLDRMRKSDGPVPFDRAAPLLAQAADALAAVHAAQLLHRDVKPANLMVEKGGRLVLMDFGLVKDPNATMLTEEGRAVGTPRYMPPEVLAAREATGAVDVWALAITTHEVLTGKQIFPVTSLTTMMSLICNDPPPDLTQDCPDLPRWFVELHLSALNKDPLLRPTAAQYRDAIRRRISRAARVEAEVGEGIALDGGTPTPRPSGRKVLTSSFKLASPSTPPPTPEPSFAHTLASRTGRIVVAALVLGVMGLGLRPRLPTQKPAAPSATPSAASTAERGVAPLEVRLEPPRRVVVSVAPALAVGARVVLDGISKNAEGTPDAPHQVAFDGLRPGAELAVKLVAADGREMIQRAVKTPMPVRVGSLLCHPTDDGVMLDFDLEMPRRITVSLHRPGQNAPVADVTREAGPRWFHHVFSGLRPHTTYVARATDPSGWSALVDYPFETKTIRHRKAMDALLPHLEKSWTSSPYDLDLIRAEPDSRSIPHIKRILQTADTAEVMDTRKLMWVIEELRDTELSGMLFDLYLKNSHKEVSHELFRGAYSGRHPALLRAAITLLERSTTGARKWLLNSVADSGTPEVCDQLARILEVDAACAEQRGPYLFVRTDPERARTHLTRWVEDPAVDAIRRDIAFGGLSVLGDERVARVLGRVVRKPARPAARMMAARYLACVPEMAARAELVAAYQADPEDAGVGWALAATGEPRAVDLFVTRLGQGKPRVQQDAAFALGVLAVNTPAAQAALRRAAAHGAAEVASAAAWALGQLGDPAACETLAALADTPRDIEGMAALALGRLKGKQSAPALAARLTALLASAPVTAPDVRGWVRMAALATALGELGDPATRPAIHALEKASAGPRACREAAQAAARQMARAPGDAPAGESRVLLIPHVPAVRGVTVFPGESVEVAGVGLLAFTHQPSPPLASDIHATGPDGARFGAVAAVGHTTIRVGRAANRLLVEQPAVLYLSAYDRLPTVVTVPREHVTGFAFLTVRR